MNSFKSRMSHFWLAAAFSGAVAAHGVAGPVYAQDVPAGAQKVLKASGPLLTEEEQTAIRRLCKYQEGEWDGTQIQMKSGMIACLNGVEPEADEMRAITAKFMERLRAAR